MTPQDLLASNELTMTVLMSPEMVNFSGKVHGGAILRLLDQVAYSCASRYCSHYVVTHSVDQVLFKQPIHVGELVTFLARVNFVGRTSMEVGIKVIAEETRTKSCRHALSCFFTMVAVDEKGAPTPVTPFEPKSPEEKRRWRMAQLRRELRAELEERYRKLKPGN